MSRRLNVPSLSLWYAHVVVEVLRGFRLEQNHNARLGIAVQLGEACQRPDTRSQSDDQLRIMGSVESDFVPLNSCTVAEIR
jgi:hypothetical protein